MIQAGDETYERTTLSPWGPRPSCEALLPQIREELNDIPGIRATAYCPSRSLMGGASERPLEFVIQSSRSYTELVNVARHVRQLLVKHPGVRSYDIDWDVPQEGKEIIVKVRRDVAPRLT